MPSTWPRPTRSSSSTTSTPARTPGADPPGRAERRRSRFRRPWWQPMRGYGRELLAGATPAYFATKPAWATAMPTRALDAGLPARWVAGDEVYGVDPDLRAARRPRGLVPMAATTPVPRPPQPLPPPTGSLFMIKRSTAGVLTCP